MRILPILIALMAACSAAAEKPNIVLFVTDDQSPIAGCYGSQVIQTPHLDALAKDGTLFTRAYATTASCSASRSVILTGLQNHANGQYGHTHDYHKFETFKSCAALSLPNQLRAIGYRTAHMGKYHIAPEMVYHFDEYLKEKGGGHNTQAWVENCEALINDKSDKPFFLNFWTHDPHRDGNVDETASEELKPNRFGNPESGKQYGSTEELIYKPEDVIVPSYLPDTIECRREIAAYYQSCTRTDKALGRLIAVLKKAGKYENTMIIYTADHGMAFPGAKTTVYEAGLRVPFVVKMPGRKGGVTNGAMISHADITPTLLDAAGGYDAEKQAPKKLLPVEKAGFGENNGFKFDKYHGRSWLALPGTTEAMGWDEVFASHTFHEIQMYYPMRAVIGRDYKLIWNIASPLPYPFASDLWAASTWQAQYLKGKDTKYGNRTVESYIQRPAFELYHLKDDPAETHNLAEEKGQAEILEECKNRIKLLQNETRDPWRIKWRYE